MRTLRLVLLYFSVQIYWKKYGKTQENIYLNDDENCVIRAISVDEFGHIR
jgi:hypothetical protein